MNNKVTVVIFLYNGRLCELFCDRKYLNEYCHQNVYGEVLKIVQISKLDENDQQFLKFCIYNQIKTTC